MKLNEVLEIKGPYNLQMLYKDGDVYVIELNLRASRSMPFTSKVTGYNIMKASAEASLIGKLKSVPHEGKFNLLLPKWFGVKSPQFSWARLRGAYPFLGPEMRSVGEVAVLAETFEEALMLSWLSVSGNRLPSKSNYILIYSSMQKELKELREAVQILVNAGYNVITVDGMAVEGAPALPEAKVVESLVNNKVDMVITSRLCTRERL
jgi:carbamoyl-phosphate synthase large subunit